MLNITFLADTLLKPSTQQSSELPEATMAKVQKGQDLRLLAYAPATNGHYKITLDTHVYDRAWLKDLHPTAKNTWFVWGGHITDPSGLGPENKPDDQPAPKPQGRGHDFALPGYSGVYFSANPLKHGYNFTWAEALHFDGAGNYRRPASAQVVEGILKVADVMQEIRARYGVPIKVNSWYRDPATNRRVGGASQSRHLKGDAVDFVVQGVHPYKVFDDLNAWWGSRGGLASSSVFTHIDCRGYRARWDYGY